MGTLMTVKVIATPFLRSQCLVACINPLPFASMRHFPFLKKTVFMQRTVGGIQLVVLIAVPMFIVGQIALFSCYLAFYQKANGRRR